MAFYHIGERPENWPSWSKPIEYAFSTPKRQEPEAPLDLEEIYANALWDITGLTPAPKLEKSDENEPVQIPSLDSLWLF